jgi:hypothetical protein
MIISANSDTHEFGITSMMVGYTGMLIAFSFVFVGIKTHRDKVLGGTISYGRGVAVGLLIAFIASTMYVITWAVVHKTFYPHFMDEFSEHMIAAIDTTGKSADEIIGMKAEITRQAADMKAGYSNPLVFALWTYTEIFPVGLLVTLISAAILRRKMKDSAAG